MIDEDTYVNLVSIARPEEEGAIMAMCRRLHLENGLFDLNEDKVRTLLRHCYARKDNNETRVIVGVIRNCKGVIEASTCLTVSTYYYADSWHLAELWNFVDEPYRRSHNAEALIQYGKACARRMGIPLITGIITNHQLSGKVRLYRRLLGTPAGAFFIYNSDRPTWQTDPIEDHSDLRERLSSMAQWASERHNKEIVVDGKKIASLLREAAQALRRDDNPWSATKTNGKSDAEHEARVA